MNKHSIHIIGNGVFGNFLKDLLAPHFNITESAVGADSLILAVPSSAYESVASEACMATSGRHLVNVCSVQMQTTNTLLKFTNQVTSIHPLFGVRTPCDKRNSILTYGCNTKNEIEFLSAFANVSRVMASLGNQIMTPELHDQIMAKTHVAAVLAAKQMKVFVDRAEDIPDELIPNSFRLLRQFVKTLDDMPQGTLESIMSNPFF